MRTRHISDGKNSQLVPNNVTFRLGEYATLPTCNASRKNHIAVQGGALYMCDGSNWLTFGTTGSGVLVVKEGGATVDATVTTLDFDASDFVLSESPEDEINISLAYGTTAGTPAEGNHTHTSTAISDFTEAAQDAVGG